MKFAICFFIPIPTCLFQSIDFRLQILQESARMGTIHLGVVKLERNRQFISEPFLSVFPPEKEWIVENAAVHTHHTIDFRFHDSRSADDHAVFG